MKSPLNIMHLITELEVGGAEQMLYKIVSSSDKKKCLPIVVSMTDVGPVGKRIISSGIPVHKLGMGFGRPDPRAIPKLINLLRKESVDILQTWLYHADMLGLIAGKIARVPKIVWGVRCSEMKLDKYNPLTSLTRRMCAFISSLPDAIIINSKKGREVHQRIGYKNNRMEVIPNGFNTLQFCPDKTAKKNMKAEIGITDDEVLIGMVARFDPMKDHRTFIQAMSLLAEKNQNAHFALIGKGMESGNSELVAEIPVAMRERFHLLGIRKDIPKIMAGLDILVNSSFGEGFSNVVGEAMSSGTVCVVSDVGDSAHIVGDTGLVVRPVDSNDLLKACLELLEMGNVGRKELGRRARKRIIERFSIGVISRRFDNFYTGLFN